MSTILHAQDLSFAYGTTPALREVSLSLSAGEMLVLIGPNGSGKSTLIRALLGQLPARGSIEWDGKPMARWSKRLLARSVGYLPQAPTCEPGQTVLDVLRMGRAPYWSAFGIESGRDAGVIGSVAKRLAITDLLDRPMDSLSGGQRQRVFVGRALAQEPRALLLDEPNTFLDLKHQVELSTLLRRLARESNVAILMASHDLNLAGMFADRLLLLDAGAVAASGTAAEVLRADVLSRVYGVAIEHVVPARDGMPPVVLPRINPSSDVEQAPDQQDAAG